MYIVIHYSKYCKSAQSVWFTTFAVVNHYAYTEGPARHIDASRQKLSPHCLETIFDSQLPSPKLSPKMPPKLSLSLAHKRGHFFLFRNNPRGTRRTEKLQKISANKLGGHILVSCCMFRSVFRFSRPTPYFEQPFTFKSKKFARKPFCEKFPLHVLENVWFARRHLLWIFPRTNKVFQRPCRSVLLPSYFLPHHSSELIWPSYFEYDRVLAQGNPRLSSPSEHTNGR